MARTTPPDRLEKLLNAAAHVFVTNGFQRTQMDDIAQQLGVSKGTIYRSVDSKEALLAAVLNYGDTPEELPAKGPIEAIALTRVSSELGSRLAKAASVLELSQAVTRPAPSNAREFAADIERVAQDMFEMMARHRIRIMVLDRCASEVPALASGWYLHGRYAVVDLWVRYLQHNQDHVDPSINQDVMARTIVELITLWAVKMPWDPAPRAYQTNLASACAAIVRNIVHGATS